MPKIKTHSSAKKRFTITGSGKVKRFRANKSHLLRKRSKRRKTNLLGSTLVHESDQKRVLVMLGIN
ncbi:MAG: 50S ribosomal protein L35 [Saprospiraceae bacterium]|nr:50S ribosomal protein L35 [Saprospiraceae bacterium]MBL0191626.1 50S ribosomal protein L35 [Saprospiraceae bacterium]MBL0294992.1 50S ribosomal protein L35 [Saprospiraceae bacterium]